MIGYALQFRIAWLGPFQLIEFVGHVLQVLRIEKDGRIDGVDKVGGAAVGAVYEHQLVCLNDVSPDHDSFRIEGVEVLEMGRQFICWTQPKPTGFLNVKVGEPVPERQCARRFTKVLDALVKQVVHGVGCGEQLGLLPNIIDKLLHGFCERLKQVVLGISCCDANLHAISGHDLAVDKRNKKPIC